MIVISVNADDIDNANNPNDANDANDANNTNDTDDADDADDVEDANDADVDNAFAKERKKGEEKLRFMGEDSYRNVSWQGKCSDIN